MITKKYWEFILISLGLCLKLNRIEAQTGCMGPDDVIYANVADWAILMTDYPMQVVSTVTNSGSDICIQVYSYNLHIL